MVAPHPRNTSNKESGSTYEYDASESCMTSPVVRAPELFRAQSSLV